jgi:hypothetical protein
MNDVPGYLDILRIAEAARDFVHVAEQEWKGSVPVEFTTLCELVEAKYGAPDGDQVIIQPMCPHEYFDPKDCQRCTPPTHGRCVHCGTLGDHYCPNDVERGERENFT